MTHANEGGGRSDPGVLLIKGDPAVLDAFSRDVLAAGRVAGQSAGDYSAAMTALAEQPIDPTFQLPANRLFGLAGRFQRVEDLCTTATVYAQALRDLDASGDGQLDAIDGLDPNLLGLYVQLKAGNPDLDAEDVDLPGLLSELYRQNGGFVDDDQVRSDIQELVDAGLIDPGDAENPALVTYLINRGGSPLGAAEEWELNSMAIAEDGSLSALGMDGWDPAVLAEIQKALDDHAAAELNDYLESRAETGQVPGAPPPGQTSSYDAEWAEAYRQLQEDFRFNAARDLVDDLASKGERGFYSADLYDGLIDGFNDGSNSRAEDALLHAITHSTMSGDIPVYEMTNWEKFRDGLGKVAIPVGWIGAAATLFPGAQIPGAIAKGSAVIVTASTAVTIADECVINEQGGQCGRTVVVAGLGQAIRLKSKALRAHLAANGPISAADERLLDGMKAYESFTDQSLTVASLPDSDYSFQK